MSRPPNPGQRSLKVIESGTIRYIAYDFLSVFYRNFVPTHAGFEIFEFIDAVTLEIGLGVFQWKCHHSVQCTRLPEFLLTFYLWLYLVSFLRYSLSKNVVTLK